MPNANQADFLGEGTVDGPKKARSRPTDPTGLFFLDTGEPTPLYYNRINDRQDGAYDGMINGQSYADNTFNPKEYNEAAASRGQEQREYKFDAEKGQYYYEVPKGFGGATNGRMYMDNNPAKAESAQDSPLFTMNPVPTNGRSADYTNALMGAATGAAVGSRGGVPGAAIGAATGGLLNLPQAQSQRFYLSSGDPTQSAPGQRLGTPAEAVQANINYANTGNSAPPGGGNNYFPQGTPTIGGAGRYQPQNIPMATYTPGAGTNGTSALSAEAQRIVQQANDFNTQNQARANSFYDQAQQAANRAAPQMTAPSSADMQAVYNRAMNFQADTSGAQRLENMQMDMQGINNLESWSPQYSMQGVQNLESWQPTNSQQGVNALYAYRPDATYRSANQLENWRAENTLEAANRVSAFRPDQVQADAGALRNWKSDRSGIDRLNQYANEAQGPSQAQAMLRSQGDADKRTMLAIARSGRGGPGANVQAQRQAMAEGGLIQAETRGQGAVLAAQEHEAYKQRQLQALAQAGSLISNAEAQRLTALAQAGQLMSTADQQNLQALMAYGELKAQADSQQLSARQSGGQLNAAADNMVLGATSNAAQLQGQMDSQILNARSNAAQLRGQMDSQSLNAISNAAQLRTQADQIRSNNLQAAGNIRIQGSGQQLQALSLAGQISSEIRNQDIGVARSNLDAQLQTMGMNDNQVRFFNQMGSDREQSSQQMVMQAGQLGINTLQAQQAIDLAWAQQGLAVLQNQQDQGYRYDALNEQARQFDATGQYNQQVFNAAQSQQNRANNRQDRNDTFALLGSLMTAGSNLFQGNSSSNAGSVISALPAAVGSGPMNMAGQPTGQPVGYNAMGMVWDPFTGQYVYPSQGAGVANSGTSYAP